MADEELLTVRQVARRLGMHEETVRLWLGSGRLRGFRPGGDRIGWRIAASDLEAFIEARRREQEERR
jgi:excisionase family DNA binding protein